MEKLTVLLAAALLGACGGDDLAVEEKTSRNEKGPLNADYRIDGTQVTLENGRAERPVAPGSAMMERIAVWGEPAFGDLDGDGDEDAVLILTQDSGGSGTFYHLVAAVRDDGHYRGTGAVFLGDRLQPRKLSVRHGVAVADYADRPEGAPMSEEPSVSRSVWTALEEGELLSPTMIPEGAELMAGELVLGHEVREFHRCGTDKQVYWVMGDISSLNNRYRSLLGSDAAPYMPVFAMVIGRALPVRTEGFGEGLRGLELEGVVRLLATAGCP